MTTGNASLGGRSAPTKEHQNINFSSSKHTMPLFYSVERTVATERERPRTSSMIAQVTTYKHGEV